MEKEHFEEIINRFKANHSKPIYKMIFNENEESENKTSIFDSKFGGVPYWDLSKELPTDKDGNKMAFVAQVNLSKENIDENDFLPKKGILQYFNKNDQDSLCYDKTDFKIVYHENIDEAVTKEQVEKLDIPNVFFIDEEKTFSLERNISVMNKSFGEYFNEELDSVVEDYKEEIGIDEDDDDAIEEFWGDYDYFDSESEFYTDVADKLEEDGYFFNRDCSMLGFPYFVQFEYGLRDVILFKIDSNSIKFANLGDCVIHISIDKKDLQELNFDKAELNCDSD